MADYCTIDQNILELKGVSRTTDSAAMEIELMAVLWKQQMTNPLNTSELQLTNDENKVGQRKLKIKGTYNG